jgi:hypothetical protein
MHTFRLSLEGIGIYITISTGELSVSLQRSVRASIHRFTEVKQW